MYSLDVQGRAHFRVEVLVVEVHDAEGQLVPGIAAVPQHELGAEHGHADQDLVVVRGKRFPLCAIQVFFLHHVVHQAFVEKPVPGQLFQELVGLDACLFRGHRQPAGQGLDGRDFRLAFAVNLVNQSGQGVENLRFAAGGFQGPQQGLVHRSVFLPFWDTVRQPRARPCWRRLFPNRLRRWCRSAHTWPLPPCPSYPSFSSSPGGAADDRPCAAVLCPPPQAVS